MTRVHRVVRMPLYGLLVLLAVSVLSPILAIGAAVKISDRATSRQIAGAERQADELREEQRLRACSVYGALVAALEESPPEAPAGKALLAEYRNQYKIRDCRRR